MKEYVIIHIGNLTIELPDGIVKVNDNIIELLVHEYKILSLLSRADINSWVSIEDIAKNLNLDKSFISNCIPNIQKKLSKHRSTTNMIESQSDEYVKLGAYIPKIDNQKFDESSKEIQEKEELIDELRYQIRRDMEDYKLVCSNDNYICGENYHIALFGDEEHYRFFRIYLRDNIEKNIKKLMELVNVR